MPKPKPSHIPDISVDDSAEAERKFENFTRKILAVPKKEIDAKIVREKKVRDKRH